MKESNLNAKLPFVMSGSRLHAGDGDPNLHQECHQLGPFGPDVSLKPPIMGYYISKQV